MLYMLGGTSYGIRNAQFTINFNDGSHYQINQAMSDWVSARCALSSTKRKLSHLICLRDTSISAHVLPLRILTRCAMFVQNYVDSTHLSDNPTVNNEYHAACDLEVFPHGQVNSSRSSSLFFQCRCFLLSSSNTSTACSSTRWRCRPVADRSSPSRSPMISAW